MMERRQVTPEELEYRRRVESTLGVLEKGLAANTVLTETTGRKLDDLIERTQPVLEIHAGLIKGTMVIGKTADFLERWGKRFAVIALYGLALFGACKVMLSGGGWTETVRAFGAIISKEVK